MQTSELALFPTRLLTLQFPDVDELNRDLLGLFATREEFRADFNMHPDALNLLGLADTCPAIARLREMFLDGLARWLRAEAVPGDLSVDVVLFSNYAKKGELTLVHNHNADVVGIYYVKTADYGRAPVSLPGAEPAHDYFDADDGVLVLHDPRFNANLTALPAVDHVKVYPRPGLMLLFPAYVWHSVTPHLGDAPRLAISANFSLRWAGASNAETWPLKVEKE